MNKTKYTKPLFAFGLLVALVCLSGCASRYPRELKPVRKSLRQANFDLLYPARSDTKPGEIWSERKSAFSWLWIRPDDLQEEAPLKLRTVTNDVVLINSTATNVTDWTLGASILGNVAPKLWKAEAALSSATVTSYSIDYGETQVEEIPFGTFTRTNEVSRLPYEYRQRLRNFNEAEGNQILFAAVLRTKGLKYEFHCEDVHKLDAKAALITKLIDAHFKPEIRGTNSAVWNVPKTKSMVIGVRFYTKESLKLVEEDAIASFLQGVEDEKIKSVKAKARAVAAKAKKKK